MSPWAITGALLLLGATFASGLGTGWKARDWKAGEEEAARLKDERHAKELQDAKATIAATKHEETKVQIRTRERIIVQEVDRVVEKPVYRNVCFDDDGMRELKRAVTGADNPPKPVDPVRPAVDAGGWDWGYAAAVGGGDGQ